MGFSAFASLGSMLDVGFGISSIFWETIRYTKSIVIYMESIGDARAFLSAAREVALTKPIIVIKCGARTRPPRRPRPHWFALLVATKSCMRRFERVGVLRVDTDC